MILALHFGHSLVFCLYLIPNINKYFKMCVCMYNINFHMDFTFQILRKVSKMLVEFCTLDFLGRRRPWKVEGKKTGSQWEQFYPFLS